jgi:hypothetical protein
MRREVPRQPDKKSDVQVAADRGERVALMERLVLGEGSRHRAALIGRGVLVSESTRAPPRLAFPAALASRGMPGLFPEHTAGQP